MQIIDTAIADVKIITPKRHGDHRGFFSEVYNQAVFAEAGLKLDFVQDNHSRSATKGTLRGLHFQSPPHAQSKLIRVLKGAIVDVAVDIRHGSPTFGQYVMVELSADSWQQLLVPKGFAHGFVTLVDDTEVFYKVDAYYSANHDFGVLWNDPDLAIAWPIKDEDIIISEKDRKQLKLADLPIYFDFNEAGVTSSVAA